MLCLSRYGKYGYLKLTPSGKKSIAPRIVKSAALRGRTSKKAASETGNQSSSAR